MARKRTHEDTWHFCSNCSDWPAAGYEEGSGEDTGEKCHECLAKINDGTCAE